MTRHDPVLGIAKKQQPFEMDYARRTARTGGAPKRRMANAENFSS